MSDLPYSTETFTFIVVLSWAHGASLSLSSYPQFHLIFSTITSQCCRTKRKSLLRRKLPHHLLQLEYHLYHFLWNFESRNTNYTFWVSECMQNVPIVINLSILSSSRDTFTFVFVFWKFTHLILMNLDLQPAWNISTSFKYVLLHASINSIF